MAPWRPALGQYVYSLGVFDLQWLFSKAAEAETVSLTPYFPLGSADLGRAIVQGRGNLRPEETEALAVLWDVAHEGRWLQMPAPGPQRELELGAAHG